MRSAPQLRRAPAALPCADLVGRWSQLHSGATFVINLDEVHCLRTIALHQADDEIALLLLRKVALARLLHPAPLDVVALNRIAEFTFGDSAVRRRRIVHPHAVRSALDLSVTSAVGAGLIGLHAGQSILWPDDAGCLRALRVVGVGYQDGTLETPANAGWSGN